MKWKIFLIVLLSFLVQPHLAQACSCQRGVTEEEKFRQASVVLIGEFQGSRRGYNRFATVNATFKVLEALKGGIKNNEILIISTAYHSTICGISVWEHEKPGAIWQIYASPVETITVPPGTILSTGLCSGTAPFRFH